MYSTSSDWQPSTVADVAARSMRQPIDDIAEGSPTRYAWPGRHVPERQYEEHCLGNTAGAGLPPALVITTQADVVRDEGEAYAGKLRDAGVPVIADRFQAIIHDFVMLNALADTDAARGAITLATDTLRTVLSDNT